MASYKTIDYVRDLTPIELQSARPLYFEPYSATSNLISWDFKAGVFGSNLYALLHDKYQFSAIEGATYDIFSSSFFDPFLLVTKK
jgi:hypothetical protein